MNYHQLTIREITKLFHEKKLSSVELTKFFLERIKRIDVSLQACISIFEKEAIEQAVEADRRLSSGETGGVLGIPYLCKDNILTKNLKTTAASRMLESYIAPYDATVIARLNQAGAVLLGKTNLDEFAQGSSTENSAFFTTKNPWDGSRVAGGSSGGSAAAVSAGLCVFALGSDTGGSIRQPASFCGVSGLKPSYSLVSRYGLMSMTSSTDVIGPLAKKAEDLAIVMDVISGFDEYDLTTHPNKIENDSPSSFKDLSGKKMGVAWEYVDSLSGEMANKIREAIEVFKSLGAEVVPLSLPYNQYSSAVYYTIMPAEVSSNLARLDGLRYGLSQDMKAKGYSEDNLNDIYLKNRGQSLGAEVKQRIILGTSILSSDHFDVYYRKAVTVREMIKDEFIRTFQEVDFILTPTTDSVALKIGQQANNPLEKYTDNFFLSGPSLAGLPAISIPVGFVNKMPVGIQLVANKFNDSLVLGLAEKFQSADNQQLLFPDLN